MIVALKYFAPDEKTKWLDLLDKARAVSGQVDSKAVDEAERLLAKGEGFWANEARRQLQRHGLRSELLSIAKAQDMVMVTHSGKVIAKTARRGVVQRGEDGVAVYQQMLWQEMTWEQFDAWVSMNDSQIEGLLVNQTAGRKIAALHVLAPFSHGPADAARRLGTTLEAVLGA